MPLAQHDALAWSTPVSPGPAPVPVGTPSIYALQLSPWFPVAILVTSIEDGHTRILRVETPTTSDKGGTFRQAWIGEVNHLVPGSQEIFPDLGSAQDAARQLLEEIWLGDSAPAPPVRQRRWIDFENVGWNDPAAGKWGGTGVAWEGLVPGSYWDMMGSSTTWENYT